jgi:hypothetical protein
MKKKGMGYQSSRMKNDEWLTPPIIIDMLGPFDLDPCSPVNRPWDTAKKHYTIEDDGLLNNWEGRVWLNPPYGKYAKIWLDKLVIHGNGIALIFARTETDMFFRYVWNHAHALLFIKGRLHFHYVDGTRANTNAGAPSVLIAYGEENSEILQNCKIEGKFIKLK